MNTGMVCFIFCFGFTEPAALTPPVDSFCRMYEQQILTKADATATKALSPSAQRRVQGNDLVYLCRCKGFKDPLCQTVQQR